MILGVLTMTSKFLHAKRKKAPIGISVNYEKGKGKVKPKSFSTLREGYGVHF